MIKYPDKVIIQKPSGEVYNPFESGMPYNTVYVGKCRAFMNRQSSTRSENVVADSYYRVVIPDRSMIQIGENWRIAVKFHNLKNNGKKWDLVGYVKDFAPYEKVCEIHFELIKEPTIIEDIPTDESFKIPEVVGTYEDEYCSISAPGMNGKCFKYGNPIVLRKKEGAPIVEFGYFEPETLEWTNISPAGHIGKYQVYTGDEENNFYEDEIYGPQAVVAEYITEGSTVIGAKFIKDFFLRVYVKGDEETPDTNFELIKFTTDEKIEQACGSSPAYIPNSEFIPASEGEM